MIIKNVLICEDIRQEQGNKLSAMGILGDSLEIELIKNAPKEIPIELALLVCIERATSSGQDIDFSLHLEILVGEKRIGKMKANISTKDVGTKIHLNVPKIGFNLSESSTVYFNTQINKKDEVVSEDNSILNIILMRDTE